MRCGIALGLNIENRLANIREGGKRAFRPMSPVPRSGFSSIYETAPVDCEPGAMPYLNAVMKINFTGPPVALLDRLLEIERARLDVQEAEKLPRIIDLDVLYAGNLVLNNPEIIIPHPRE
jgi:2-amino-4-hydroxy-6-hydroxymethyldihydropteridine diphosphokinase